MRRHFVAEETGFWALVGGEAVLEASFGSLAGRWQGAGVSCESELLGDDLVEERQSLLLGGFVEAYEVLLDGIDEACGLL